MTRPKHIERFSPEWVLSIPRWLARGIWDAIDEGINGKEVNRATENERRRTQINCGSLKATSRGTTQIKPGAIFASAKRRLARTKEVERGLEERAANNARRREAVTAANIGRDTRSPDDIAGNSDDASGGELRIPDGVI